MGIWNGRKHSCSSFDGCRRFASLARPILESYILVFLASQRLKGMMVVNKI